jgi:hypothetical protein
LADADLALALALGLGAGVAAADDSSSSSSSSSSPPFGWEPVLGFFSAAFLPGLFFLLLSFFKIVLGMMFFSVEVDAPEKTSSVCDPLGYQLPVGAGTIINMQPCIFFSLFCSITALEHLMLIAHTRSWELVRFKINYTASLHVCWFGPRKAPRWFCCTQGI